MHSDILSFKWIQMQFCPVIAVPSTDIEPVVYIYDHTFTAEPGPRFVMKDYKSPKLLQINRHSRAKFAKSHYGDDNTFYLGLKGMIWLDILPEGQTLRVALPEDFYAWRVLF